MSCSNTNCIICAKSFVTNLAGKDLLGPQILLLSIGLSFIATARDSNSFELLRNFDSFSKIFRALSHAGYRRMVVKKFPFKRINSMRTHFSSSKLEGVLEAIKIEISQIPTTDNLPHNLST